MNDVGRCFARFGTRPASSASKVLVLMDTDRTAVERRWIERPYTGDIFSTICFNLGSLPS
jgi:hypothetical protein